MNVLVIGQGGREHALVHYLKKSSLVSAVHAVPGSDGIATEAIVHSIDVSQHECVLNLVEKNKIDLVVIGPENPLVEGLADSLRARGVLVFGPGRAAAQLEGSKIFCKQFLIDAGCPTARSFTVSSVEETLAAAKNFSPPYVLKADGLAAGKGVFICKTLSQLQADAHALFVERTLGEAGRRALLEEFQPGYEISYLILTNGEHFQPLVLAQDHKRLLDGDEGPNTGGMGTVAPVKIADDLDTKIREEICQKVMHEFSRRKMEFRGVLFIGLMITREGPSVLEFNVRFGDPETQVILPLFDGDWAQVLLAIARGQVPQMKFKPGAAACLVLAAEKYPDDPVKGVLIEGDLTSLDLGVVFHAGTKLDASKRWVTNGGRVLNVVATGTDVQEALDKAYARATRVGWAKMQLRTDIGKGLLQ